MVAGIEIIDGQALYVDTRDDAWHKLGTVVPQGMTILEGMQVAHLLGWDVRKLQVFAEEVRLTPLGVETIKIPGTGRFLTVRTNPINGNIEFLGDVGSRYTVIQNEGHAEFLQLLVGMTNAEIQTAGSLDGGARVFISMKVPNHINVGGDVTDLYLIGMNTHDGTSGLDVFLSAIRPVCKNTVTAALRGAKHRISIRHTASATGRIQDAREALDMTFKYTETYQTEAERLLGLSFTDAQFDGFLASLFDVAGKDKDDISTRMTNQMQEVRNLWESSPTLLGTKDTRFGAFQAATEYFTHFSGAHGKTRDERDANRAQRDVLDSKLRTKAWDILATV